VKTDGPITATAAVSPLSESAISMY